MDVILGALIRVILLSAICIDGNNCIFPVVYCVAEIKNKIHGHFFLNLLCKEVNDPGGWTFISDRQKGLIPAMGNVFPGVEHRFCVRHMPNNFKKLHSGES